MTTPPSEPAQPDDEPTAKLPPDEPTAQLPPAKAGGYDPFAASPAAGSAPPPGSPPPPPTATATVEPPPERPSLVQRTLPLAIAAVLGGAVAGTIVAVADRTHDTNVTVQTPAAAAASGTTTPQAAPAPATPPAQTQPGAETQPGAGSAPEQAAPQAGDAWLGVEPTAVDAKLADRVRLASDHGVMIASLVPDGPADQAGLQDADGRITIDGQEYAFGGDIVTAIDGQPVRTVDELRRIIAGHSAGDRVQLQVTHADGDQETVEVELGARPAEGQAAPSIVPDPNGQVPDGLPDLQPPPGTDSQGSSTS